MKMEIRTNIYFKNKMNSMCRVCLDETIENVVSLFEIRDDIMLSSKLMMCTQVKMHQEDGLPKVICLQCSRELDAADVFRIKCQNSDYLLRKMCNIDNIKDDTQIDISSQVEVKQETIYDSSDERHSENSNISINESAKPLKDIKSELDCNKRNDESNTIKGRKEKIKVGCPHCKKILHSEKAVQKHIKLLHLGGDRRFYCEECNYNTVHKEALANHVRTHSGDRPFQCHICKKGFTQRSSQLKHIKTHSKQYVPVIYTCVYCGEQFKDKHQHKDHKRVHANEIKYNCPVCNKGFKCKYVLKTHKLVHSDNKYTCSICNKGFKHISSYRSHLNRHSNIKNYACHTCGCTFVTVSELNNHSLTHKDIWFKCHMCNFQSKRKHILREHIAKHTGEFPYRCEQCSWATCRKCKLVEHMRKHNKEKIYLCSLCDIKYSHSSSLKRHMLKIHRITYKAENKRHIHKITDSITNKYNM